MEGLNKSGFDIQSLSYNSSDLPHAFGGSDDLVRESAAVSSLLPLAGMPVCVIPPDNISTVENSSISDTLLEILTIPPKPRGQVVCCRKAVRVVRSLLSVSGSLTGPVRLVLSIEGKCLHFIVQYNNELMLCESEIA